ncbi:MAG: exodeoxyribonuclease VII small subunit [Kiritimatiellae bacterium]|nr:exodeoxyribonuclease VII small subunit [Kiritimatiellia bacterium]MDD4341495.1 exodeoxyribonuclease VII small subunit [Kiritimatiellia bacterium]
MVTEKKDKPQSFEKALKRLEEIAEAMESGDLGLEKMVAAFEEGQKLVKRCSSKLNEVEKKIEILVKQSDGTVVAEPFGEEEGGG